MVTNAAGKGIADLNHQSNKPVQISELSSSRRHIVPLPAAWHAGIGIRKP